MGSWFFGPRSTSTYYTDSTSEKRSLRLFSCNMIWGIFLRFKASEASDTYFFSAEQGASEGGVWGAGRGAAYQIGDGYTVRFVLFCLVLLV